MFDKQGIGSRTLAGAADANDSKLNGSPLGLCMLFGGRDVAAIRSGRNCGGYVKGFAVNGFPGFTKFGVSGLRGINGTTAGNNQPCCE